MIKYKATVGAITTELECQTIGELIEYLNYDKEDQEKSRVVVETDQIFVNNVDKTTTPCFVRPDNSVHFPKIKTINGELWYVNDGKQPVGDDVKVDVLYENDYILSRYNAEKFVWSNKTTCYITHWRLAK